MEIGYLTVLQVRLGVKIGDLHAKDFSAFCKRQILRKSAVCRKKPRHRFSKTLYATSSCGLSNPFAALGVGPIGTSRDRDLGDCISL